MKKLIIIAFLLSTFKALAQKVFSVQYQNQADIKVSVDENDIFIYKKNNNDKRIKEIRLNPEYFNF